MAQMVAFFFGMLVAVSIMKQINPQLMQDDSSSRPQKQMMPPQHGPQHNHNRKR